MSQYARFPAKYSSPDMPHPLRALPLVPQLYGNKVLPHTLCIVAEWPLQMKNHHYCKSIQRPYQSKVGGSTCLRAVQKLRQVSKTSGEKEMRGHQGQPLIRNREEAKYTSHIVCASPAGSWRGSSFARPSPEHTNWLANLLKNSSVGFSPFLIRPSISTSQSTGFRNARLAGTRAEQM
jgi:hypothetical protein